MNHLSLSSVVSAAKHFLSQESLLHGLINNAGIMATPFEMTSDGYEAQWQTNHLAHWLFTSHLLPLMLQTSRSSPTPGTIRIVNLSSSGHYFAPSGGINFEDTSLPAASGMERYGQSKLANVLHMKILNKLYGPSSPSARSGDGEIWVSAVHPGLVDSNLGTRAETSRIMMSLISVYGALGGRFNADKGSWTSVFCAASPQMKKEQSGEYFQRIAESGWQSKMAKDMGLADKLEIWTRQEMEKGGWC